MFKRIISVLLAVLMLGSLCVGAFASDEAEAPAAEEAVVHETAEEPSPAAEAPETEEEAAPEAPAPEEAAEPAAETAETDGDDSDLVPEEEETLPEDAPAPAPAPAVIDGDPEDEDEGDVADGSIPGTDITWSLRKGVLTITGTGEMPSLPNPPWRTWYETITKVVIGEGITFVGGYVARGFQQLTEVILPESATEIGEYAFYGCPSLTKIVIPEGVTELEQFAFSHCANLSQVTLPTTIERIGNSCFSDCSSDSGGLRSISLPEGLRQIAEYAFANDHLTEIQLPESLDNIGPYAFYNNDFETVTIPGGVSVIGYAFSSCSNLRSVTVEEGVSEISPSCFESCQMLSVIHLPSTLDTIAPNAFKNTALTSLGLPEVEGFTAYLLDEDDYILEESDVLNGSYSGFTYIVWLRDGGDFIDVPDDSWYADAVWFCYQAGLMYGVSDTKFDPNGSATRAQVVTVLWRLADAPEGSECTFTDISAGKYYTDAVAWADENGIAAGYPDGTFRPNTPVTRQEFLTFLYRFTEAWAGEQPDPCDNDVLADFADRDKVSSWAQKPECWSVAAGLQSGSLESGVLYLNPLNSIRRSELASFLMRYVYALAETLED